MLRRPSRSDHDRWDEPPDIDAYDTGDDDDELVRCPHCKRWIYEDTDRCPHCGNNTYHSPTGLPRWAWITAVVMLIVILVTYVLYDGRFF